MEENDFSDRASELLTQQNYKLLRGVNFCGNFDTTDFNVFDDLEEMDYLDYLEEFEQMEEAEETEETVETETKKYQRFNKIRSKPTNSTFLYIPNCKILSMCI